jgi:ferredoxin
MLVINQTQCIDCGSCEPLCPSEAIIPTIDDVHGIWGKFNDEYAARWPRLKASQKEATPDDADLWKSVPDKLRRHFDPRPAQR